MPIYEYRCKKGHTFEVRQGFSDDPVNTCEVCGIPVQRVFHPVAVHFKGSGFYNTDYGTRRRSREKEAADSANEGSKESKDSKDKKDTKDSRRARSRSRAPRTPALESSDSGPKKAAAA